MKKENIIAEVLVNNEASDEDLADYLAKEFGLTKDGALALVQDYYEHFNLKDIPREFAVLSLVRKHLKGV